MHEVHESEIDGVRCFWVETGRPTLSARLQFRAGMVDEQLTTTGWLHLVEHLSLHGHETGALHVNGAVGLLHTSFDTHGPHAAVVDHLARLAAWLREPRYDELERERRVLRAESELRGSTIGARVLAQRYGARGPGLTVYPDVGLGRATPDLLTSHAHDLLTRGNAVLVLDGPPPKGLSIDLPDGDLRPPPRAVACDDVLPAAYVEGAGMVVSGVVQRTFGALYLPALVEHGLSARLRDEAGAAYAPWSAYEAVDVDSALTLAGSDVSSNPPDDVVDVVLGVVEALRRDGADEEVLAGLVERRIQAMTDPYAAFGFAVAVATQVQNGEPARTLEELVERARPTAEDLDQAAGQLASSLLLGVPPDVAWHDQLPVLSMEVGPPATSGRRHRSRNWPVDREVIVVGADFLEVRNDDGARRIDLDTVVGYFKHDDGGRHLVRADGYQIGLEPGDWRAGDKAAAALDSLVPDQHHLPMPARRDPPRRPVWSPWRRWWWRLRHRLQQVPVGVYRIFLVVVVVGAVLAALADEATTVPILPIGLACYALWRSFGPERPVRRSEDRPLI